MVIDASQKNIYQKLMEACQTGDLERVREILRDGTIDVQYDENRALIEAANSGHLHIIRYLLTSPDLKRHADIHAKSNMALRYACYSGHLHVVRYLLTSPELKEHARINTESNISGLSWAISNNCVNIVEYLLFSDELNQHADITHNDFHCLKNCFSETYNTLNFILNDERMKVHHTPLFMKHLIENYIQLFHDSLFTQTSDDDIITLILDFAQRYALTLPTEDVYWRGQYFQSSKTVVSAMRYLNNKSDPKCKEHYGNLGFYLLKNYPNDFLTLSQELNLDEINVSETDLYIG